VPAAAAIEPAGASPAPELPAICCAGAPVLDELHPTAMHQTKQVALRINGIDPVRSNAAKKLQVHIFSRRPRTDLETGFKSTR
jgi:hypothetical protein